MDLLSDMGLMGNPDNLCINPSVNNRFNPYKPPTGQENLDEVLDGKWYQDTDCIKVALKNRHIFYLPIIIYMDKMGMDALQQYGLEPVIFTMASQHYSCRRSRS